LEAILGSGDFWSAGDGKGGKSVLGLFEGFSLAGGFAVIGNCETAAVSMMSVDFLPPADRRDTRGDRTGSDARRFRLAIRHRARH
jgi:hypothetical protein